MEFQLLGINGWLIAVPLIFNVFDIIAGVIKAVCLGNLSSTKWREGLMHKASYILLLLLAVALQLSGPLFGWGVGVPSVPVVAALIVIGECISIIENIGEMNPNLANSKLFQIFENFIHTESEKQ